MGSQASVLHVLIYVSATDDIMRYITVGLEETIHIPFVRGIAQVSSRHLVF